MIAWLLYCLVVTALVAAAARAADGLARILGYRLRWIWTGALALTAYLSITSAVQRFEQPQSLTFVVSAIHTSAAPATHPTWTQSVRAFVSRAEHAMAQPFAFVARAVDGTVSSTTTTYAAVAWAIFSLALATIFFTIIYRFQGARRHWPRSRLYDVDVRVSPSVGPVVVGLVRPEIIVPRWLLHRTADEQQLAVAHEQEHLRARDPILLGLAWLTVIIAPWNLGAWYLLSRLRLAIELDCDARVLRRGAAPRAYGSLLIEVAQNASPLSLSALGFADESSQLYQRILALRGPAGGFARTRAVCAGLVAAAGLLVACSITPPQPSPPSPASVPSTGTTPPSVAATPARDSATVAAVSSPAPSRPAQRRSTSAPTTAVSSADSTLASAAMTEPPSSTDPRSPQASDSDQLVRHLDSIGVKSDPLFIIDGVRSKMTTIKDIDPKTIENVEVIKGAAAIAQYGPGAERGVIIVNTKQTTSPY